MGRVCLLLLLGATLPLLGACGEAPEADGLLTAEAPGSEPTRKGSILAAGEQARVPSREGGGGAADPIDGASAIGTQVAYPTHTNWGRARQAIGERARTRRARDLGEDEKSSSRRSHLQVALRLPGLKAPLMTGKVEHNDGNGGDKHLLLHLGGTPASPHMKITARGNQWALDRGCVEELNWSAERWDRALWKKALQLQQDLGGSTWRVVIASADDGVPAEVVVGHLNAATEMGVLELRFDDGFSDPSDVALLWLAAHQLPDGRWSDEFALDVCYRARNSPQDGGPGPIQRADTGTTAIALLAFLACGYTNRGKHPFAKCVSRGLRYLKTVEAKSGNFSGAGGARDHAWATLAMLEAFAKTGSPIWKKTAVRGLASLEANWRSSGDDPVVTAATSMACKSAELINENCVKRGKPEPLELPAKLRASLLDEAIVLSKDASPARCVAGLLCRSLAGDEPEEHAELLPRLRHVLQGVAERGGDVDAWLLYHSALLAYRWDSDANRALERMMKSTIAPRRQRKGLTCCYGGSWDPAPDQEAGGGRVSATAFFVQTQLLHYRIVKVQAPTR